MSVASILIFVFEILYLLIPAAVANTMPVFVKKYFKRLDYPIDFYKKISGERVLGDNKTFRGFIFGILGSIIIVLIQSKLYNLSFFFYKHSLIDYSNINVIFFGLLSGFSVLLFDSIASFIKRRLKVKPGKSLLILDQVNGGLGFGLFLLLFFIIVDKISPDLYVYIFIFSIILTWTIGHFIIKYLGYLLKLEKAKI